MTASVVIVSSDVTKQLSRDAYELSSLKWDNRLLYPYSCVDVTLKNKTEWTLTQDSNGKDIERLNINYEKTECELILGYLMT